VAVKDPKEGGVCWNCRKPVAAEDHYCRFCGKDLVSFPWYYQHWGILVLTFFALGPFSLVLVWRSPAISRTARWIYTALAMFLTYELALGCYHIYLIANNAVSNLLSGSLPAGL
jgi:hypothetical protein